MPQQIDFSGIPKVGEAPSVPQDQPGLLSRSWDWLTSPVSFFEPFVERQTQKISSMIPEGQYREDVEKLSRENIGGVLSPLSFLGELGVGLGAARGISKVLKGTKSIVKEGPEIIPETKRLLERNPIPLGSSTLETRSQIGDIVGIPRLKTETGLREHALQNVDEFGRTRQDRNPSINAAMKSNVSEIQQAAEQVIKTRGKETTPVEAAQIQEGFRKGTMRDVYDKLGTSGFTILDNMGSGGKELSRYLRLTRAQSKSAAGTVISKYRAPIEELSSKEFEQAVDLLESGQKSDSVKMNNAVNAMKSMLDETGKFAEESGVIASDLSGKTLPFKRIQENYFPHKFAPGTFDEGSLINNLVKQGMSPEQARFVVQQGIKEGPKLIDPQHMRNLNLPGYLKTKGSLYEHVDDLMSKSIETKRYGPTDLGDPESAISQLVSKAENPEQALQIVRDQLGRVGRDPNLTKFANAINTFEATVKLPLFAISNMNQLAATGMRTSTKSFISGLTDTLKNIKSAEDTGALQTTALSIMRETGQNPVTRFASQAFGWQKSEEFLRSWAANAGRSQADELFKSLKKNPNNKTARAQLDDLLLEDVDTILKQPNLSDEQKKIAGFRMSELTQGLVDPADLPPVWSENPLFKIPLMFKRFAFQQNKILKDAFLSNKTPADKAKFIGKVLALYTATGEATGDIKKGISSTVAGENPLQAIMDRGEGVDRILQDLGDGYALGLMGELIQQAGSGSTDRFLKFLAGPAISDITNVGVAIGSGDPTRVGRELTRLTPLGYSTSKRLFPTNQGPKPIMGGR